MYRGAVYRPVMDDPTPEMIESFEKRTSQHIDLVRKYMKLLAGFGNLDADELAERGEEHDADKWEMQTPYCWVTEYYRFKNSGKDIPADVQKQYDLSREATGQHVKQNQHHPEAHDDIADMTDLDLAEMVADWSAMAEELDQGSARGWADKNVGKKWKFTDEQTETIYDMIDWLEEA